MMNRQEQQDAIAKAIAEFPATFGLCGHKGTFRLSQSCSYIGEGNTVMLYTEKLFPNDKWLSFAKGTVSELKRDAVR
jgi:predicted amino acid dehydrogenase